MSDKQLENLVYYGTWIFAAYSAWVVLCAYIMWEARKAYRRSLLTRHNPVVIEFHEDDYRFKKSTLLAFSIIWLVLVVARLWMLGTHGL